MDYLEQENRVLQDEVAAMQAKMDEMTEKMKTMEAAQIQTSPPPIRTQAEASSSVIPEWTIGADTPTHSAPQRSMPWFPPLTAGEILRPVVCEAQISAPQYIAQVPLFPAGETFRPVAYESQMPTRQYTAQAPPLSAGETLRPVAYETRIPARQHAAFVPPRPGRAPPANTTYSAPVIHTVPCEEEPIYHSGNVEAYDRMNDLQEKYDEMQREMRALRGKELFGKTAYDLCLVPDIQIPHKFKVPDFEKYKGNSCPEEHLTMYVRRMSAYARDDQVLIYYFQESLASPASKWYMNLDKTRIRTFRDLCEAFVQQYQYNVDMAPDRSDLQAMTQGNKETFKEYAQRWRDTAAQVSPRIEEKEMTKLFLKTLNQFYYEKMVGSAPKNFAEMVGMGVQLEEGVREGRLVKEGTSASGTKKFGNNFSRKKDQEISMVAHGRPRQNYPAYQHIATITPAANTTQTLNYQPQLPQYPQQQPHQQYPQQCPQQQPYQQRPQQQPYQQYPQQPYQQQRPRPQNARLQIDPIPMTYAEILPWLLGRDLVQTREPPPVPEKLPVWYRPDQTCAFHQGGRGHSIENCYGLKNAVQRLIDGKRIFFTDSAPNVQTNPLPNHGVAIVNMVTDVQQCHRILDIQHIRTPLVPLHAKLCEVNLFKHDHDVCKVCLQDPWGCQKVKDDVQALLNRGELVVERKCEDVCVIAPEGPFEIFFDSRKSAAPPLIIRVPGPIPPTSEKAVPYKYNATMTEGAGKAPVLPSTSVGNIAENSRVLRNGRVIPVLFPKKVGAPVFEETQAKDSGAV